MLYWRKKERTFGHLGAAFAIGLVIWFSFGGAPLGKEIKHSFCPTPETAPLSHSLKRLEEQGRIKRGTLTREYYRKRKNCPAWIHDWRFRVGAIQQLLSAVEQSRRHGLNPQHYHRDAIREWLKRISGKPTVSAREALDMDVLLTESLLRLGTHLHEGSVSSPLAAERPWLKHKKENVAEVLAQALEKDALHHALDRLAPQHKIYRRLSAALTRYEKIQERGGWPIVPRPLSPKSQGNAVATLSRRLEAEGYLLRQWQGPRTVYDQQIQNAVRRFQKAHGLHEDGIVGPSTLKALNVRVKERIQAIQANLERERWMPRKTESLYVLVNIARFELHLVANGKIALTMPVVVGRETKETPVITDEITYLVLNPDWIIPAEITREEILNDVLQNPEHLQMKGYRIFRENEPVELTVEEIEDIDWQDYLDAEANFPYRFIQQAGPMNPLGDIKFMFPNPRDVYLHGTRNPALFKAGVRTFSHGCIRVQNPMALALHLLRGADPPWTRRRIEQALTQEKPTPVKLPLPVAVYIRYLTVDVDRQGMVKFLPDVYGWNQKLVSQMKLSDSSQFSE